MGRANALQWASCILALHCTLFGEGNTRVGVRRGLGGVQVWKVNLVTSVKLASELGEITFSTGKPKLTHGEVPTFQGF